MTKANKKIPLLGPKLKGTNFAIREGFSAPIRQAGCKTIVCQRKGSPLKLQFDKLTMDWICHYYDVTSDIVTGMCAHLREEILAVKRLTFPNHRSLMQHQGTCSEPVFHHYYFHYLLTTYPQEYPPKWSSLQMTPLHNAITGGDDAIKLQQNLTKINDWCCIWLTQLKPSNCSLVNFTRKNLIYAHGYTLHGHTLDSNIVQMPWIPPNA